MHSHMPTFGEITLSNPRLILFIEEINPLIHLHALQDELYFLCTILLLNLLVATLLQ